MKVFLFLLVFVSISFSITLEEAVKVAKDNATKVRLSRLEIEKAKEQIRQARAKILPSVSFTYSYTHLGGELATGLTPRDRHAYSLSLNQTLFDLFLFRSLDVAKENLQLQRLILDDITREVEYQTKVLFYGLLYKKQLVKVYEEELSYWEENYKLVKAKYDAGIVPKVELLRSQSQLENARARLEMAKSDYANALEDFKVFLRLESITEPEGSLEPRIVAYELDSLKQALLENNTTLKVAQEYVELQKKRVQQAKALYYPTVGFSATYQGSTSRTGTSTHMRDGYTIGLSLNYNIFDGFSRDSTVAQGEIELLKLKEEYMDKREKLVGELNKLINTIKALEIRISASKTALEAAEESLRLSKERYRLGIATQLEVLDSINNYNNTLLNLNFLYYQYNINVALLERLVR